MVMGSGMSLIMTELGAALGTFAMMIGILISLLGIALAAFAYPLFRRTLKKERAKIAPDILRLTNELMR